MWLSDKFENTYQAGFLLVLPRELMAFWTGEGQAYDDLCELAPGPFDFLPVGSGFGVFVAGPGGDIVHEAHWVR